MWMMKCKKHHCQCNGLMKLSLVAFVLFVLQVWPDAMNLVHMVHWGWFLMASVLLALIPMKHMCMHKMGMMNKTKKKRRR